MVEIEMNRVDLIVQKTLERHMMFFRPCYVLFDTKTRLAVRCGSLLTMFPFAKHQRVPEMSGRSRCQHQSG